MTAAADFVAALVGLRPPDAATKSKNPAFSKPRQRSPLPFEDRRPLDAVARDVEIIWS